MDERRFDRLSSMFGAATSRRAGLTSVLAALLGGAATASAAGKRGAARGEGRPRAEGPCGDGSAKPNACTRNKQCCTGVCDREKQRCRCVQIGGACRQNRNCCRSMTCTNGICSTPGPVGPTCTAATCANGCCDGSTCVTATSVSACGTGGAACVTCSSSALYCTAGTCSAGTWDNQTTFGTSGSGDSSFTLPSGVVLSPDLLTLWVADSGNNRITVWTRTDKDSTTWSFNAKFGVTCSCASNLSSPNGVAVSADGLTIWVTDTGVGRIAVWTRTNTSSTNWIPSASFGLNGSGDVNMSAPKGVFASEDTLTAWVADTGNNRIVVWTRDNTAATTWNYSTQFGSGPASGDSNFNTPSGVFISEDMLTAWVGDTLNNRISIWTRSTTSSTTWTHSTSFGTNGSSADQFNAPKGVFVSANSLTAWVADQSNNRISIWTQS